MTPAWPDVADAVARALPLWDAWCPDDGRPAAALAAARAYTIDPTPQHRMTLIAATGACREACQMVITYLVLTGYDPSGSPALAAHAVALAAWTFGNSLLIRSPNLLMAAQTYAASATCFQGATATLPVPLPVPAPS